MYKAHRGLRFILLAYGAGEPRAAKRTRRGKDSVLPLLLLPDSNTNIRRLPQVIEIRSRIRADMALDLLVRTPQQVERRLEMGDSCIRDILERGKVIYEANATLEGGCIA